MIATAQLMVVLDATIVNIALPSVQSELGLSDANRQWVITAYALAFGGLLLLGGRISGSIGHRRAFVIGLIGFAVASVLGGAANGAAPLFAGRAAQGMFAALLAPAALSLLTMTFVEARERARAFGVFAAVGAGGSAVGMVAGGLLTEHADWRWCLYVNLPIAGAALAGSVFLRGDAPRRTGDFDVPGVVVSAAGLVALVYAFTLAEGRGWGDRVVVLLLVGGTALLALFALIESRTKHPLLPLRIVAHRLRGGTLLAIGLTQVAMFGFYLFMTYYMQGVLRYSPVQAGVVFLLTAAGIAVGATVVAGSLLSRITPRALLVAGLVVTAAGMSILTRLTADTDNVFLLYLLPAQLLIGLGLGCVMTPATSLATSQVAVAEAGIASATFNAAQQLGGALGTALLNTVAASVAAAALVSHGGPSNSATVHGFSVALTVAVGVLIAAALIAWLVIGTDRERRAADLDETELKSLQN
ncbi:MFS transporter [Nocardia sp. XZ_19_385]|uniref:MFS transporter n=1 Tax=Nocardia sp. XZ_19_385 TaxID=2769488 RepID=UPI0028163715|nr:MFS transporter [Nocardia sp. XZ_19_385]